MASRSDLDALEQLGIAALHASTFRRALVNLVHNAIDAMPQGGTLTLQRRRQAATVHSPCGIPAMAFPQSIPRRFLNRCIPRNREARDRDNQSPQTCIPEAFS